MLRVSLRKKKEGKTEQKKKLSNQLNALNTAKADKESILKETVELDKTLEKKRGLLDSISKQIDLHNEAVAEAAEKRAKSDTAMTALLSEEKKIQKRIDGLEGAEAAGYEKINSTEARYKELIEDLNKVILEVAEFEAKKKDHDKDVAVAEKEKSSLTTKIQSLTKEKEKIEKSLEKIKDSSEKAIVTANNDIKILEEKEALLKNEIMVLSEKQKDISKETSLKQSELDSLNKELDTRSSDIEEREKELEEEGRILNNAKAELKKMYTSLQKKEVSDELDNFFK